jgi:hypothetical protein
MPLKLSLDHSLHLLRAPARGSKETLARTGSFLALALGPTLVLACGADDGKPDAALPRHVRCSAPAGVSASPRTIEDTVTLVNALPKPTSVACLVESLARPLPIVATSSAFSAQPALSARSPRVFLALDRLWLSIVLEGDSSHLVEMSYLLEGETRSIKGELELPLGAAITASAPYEQVRITFGTACQFCHFDERAEQGRGIPDVFSSVAFRPRPESLVSIDALRFEAQGCDPRTEPHRCEMLSALFDGGPVVEGAFPGEMATFF